MLELVGVRHRYDGRVVLDLARFEVPPGALIAMVGPNGSGKSTLLRLLALLEPPTEGEVRLDGRPVSGGPARARPDAALRRRVTLVEQRPILLRGTVRDNLGFGLRARGMRRADVNKVTEAVAARFGVTPLLERHHHELSEGEVQRVAVARALPLAPALLLLVEPVSWPDRAAAQPLPSSGRNVFAGRVTRLSRQRPGDVHVTADVGVELVAMVTEEAARDLQLAPGGPVVFAFKASAVRVF